MTTRKRHYLGVAALLGVLSLGGANVRAGVWDEVAIGLGSAGFDIRGGHNVLSGGTDILVTNTFQGQTFDFGALELTLNGPLSLDLSTGGRLLSNLDIALTTAASSDFNAAPLTYELAYDVGGQQTSITGTLLIDGAVSLNRFGWYELNVDYSSRQTVVNDGRFDTGVQDFDFDLGPINVRGNIFADILAVVTDPFFEAVNAPNVFASFSGQQQLKRVLEARLEQTVAQWASEIVSPPTASELRSPFSDLSPSNAQQPSDASAQERDPNRAILAAFDPTGGVLSPIGFASDSVDAVAFSGVVPEPSVLLLMLLGVPAILSRRRRATHR